MYDNFLSFFDSFFKIAVIFTKCWLQLSNIFFSLLAKLLVKIRWVYHILFKQK